MSMEVVNTFLVNHINYSKLKHHFIIFFWGAFSHISWPSWHRWPCDIRCLWIALAGKVSESLNGSQWTAAGGSRRPFTSNVLLEDPSLCIQPLRQNIINLHRHFLLLCYVVLQGILGFVGIRRNIMTVEKEQKRKVKYYKISPGRQWTVQQHIWTSFIIQ